MLYTKRHPMFSTILYKNILKGLRPKLTPYEWRVLLKRLKDVHDTPHFVTQFGRPTLISAFIWEYTPYGFKYWNALHMKQFTNKM